MKARALRRQWLRLKARNDPNAFIEYVVRADDGEPLYQAPIHRQMQHYFSSHPKVLLRAPRYHGKSIQTFARAVWELGRNPNLRIKVVCGTDELAKKRVRKMRQWVDSPIVRNVFPRLKREDGSWTNHAFTVERTGDIIDPSVEAYGWNATATGGRADILIFDDVTNEKNSLMSKALRESVKVSINNEWLNLGHPDSRVWFEGNAWHFDDAFHLRCANPGDFAFLDLRIDGKLTPIWPSKWPTESLKAQRKLIGDKAFARGFHCYPLSEAESVFDPDWIHFWRPGDLPTAEAEDEDGSIVNALDLDTYMGIDPAFSEKQRADESAIVVIGVKDKRRYVLKAVHHRGLSLLALRNLAMQLIRQYHPRRVWVETNAAQVYVADEIRAEVNRCRDIDTRIYGEPTTSKTGDKDARMALLADQFEAGNWYLRGNGDNRPHKSQETLYHQLVQFPNGDHDDLCDALDFAQKAVPRTTSGCPVRRLGR